MIPFKKEDINRKYSPTWVYCNDNSRSKLFRERFIQQFGGEFVKEKYNYFRWKEITRLERRRKFIIEDKNGILYTVDNMYEFCKKNKLKRAAMYECIAGKRKSHHGFKFVAEIPWK